MTTVPKTVMTLALTAKSHAKSATLTASSGTDSHNFVVTEIATLDTKAVMMATRSIMMAVPPAASLRHAVIQVLMTEKNATMATL